MSGAQDGPSARPGEAGAVASGRDCARLGVRTLLLPQAPVGPSHRSPVGTGKEGQPQHRAAVFPGRVTPFVQASV